MTLTETTAVYIQTINIKIKREISCSKDSNTFFIYSSKNYKSWTYLMALNDHRLNVTVIPIDYYLQLNMH